jgi:hypothetical protein
MYEDNYTIKCMLTATTSPCPYGLDSLDKWVWAEYAQLQMITSGVKYY